MSFKLKWNGNFNTKENLSFMIVGPAQDCLQITKQAKIFLDERFKNKKSTVHCCEDLDAIVDELNVLIDFIVILIDCTHQRTSELHIKNTISKIDPKYIINSRVIFIKLFSYSTNLKAEISTFANELSKKYDSICLTGSTEELEFVNEISQSIIQYACYIFQKKFITLYTNNNKIKN